MVVAFHLIAPSRYLLVNDYDVGDYEINENNRKLDIPKRRLSLMHNIFNLKNLEAVAVMT